MFSPLYTIILYIRPRILYEGTKLPFTDKIWKFPSYAFRCVCNYLCDVECSVLFSYFMAHMFGRRLMYPGSLALIQTAMSKWDIVFYTI